MITKDKLVSVQPLVISAWQKVKKNCCCFLCLLALTESWLLNADSSILRHMQFPINQVGY